MLSLFYGILLLRISYFSHMHACRRHPGSRPGYPIVSRPFLSILIRHKRDHHNDILFTDQNVAFFLHQELYESAVTVVVVAYMIALKPYA